MSENKRQRTNTEEKTSSALFIYLIFFTSLLPHHTQAALPDDSVEVILNPRRSQVTRCGTGGKRAEIIPPLTQSSDSRHKTALKRRRRRRNDNSSKASLFLFPEGPELVSLADEHSLRGSRGGSRIFSPRCGEAEVRSS